MGRPRVNFAIYLHRLEFCYSSYNEPDFESMMGRNTCLGGEQQRGKEIPGLWPSAEVLYRCGSWVWRLPWTGMQTHNEVLEVRDLDIRIPWLRPWY